MFIFHSLFHSVNGYDEKSVRRKKNKRNLYLWSITHLEQHEKKVVSNSLG